MFERFTDDARDAISQAQHHARRLGHGWIGCELLLLAVAGARGRTAALLRDSGVAPEAVEETIAALIGAGPSDSDDKLALATLGIDLDEVRNAVDATFGSGALEAPGGRRRRGRRRLLPKRSSCRPSSASTPYSPRAKRCLEQSLREALRLKDDHIGVEHIALALLAKDDTAAWSVLVHLGVEPSDLRRRIEQSHRRTA